MKHKMIVELEWDDDMGECWMNLSNLGMLLYTDTHTVREHLSAKVQSANGVFQKIEKDY